MCSRPEEAETVPFPLDAYLELMVLTPEQVPEDRRRRVLEELLQVVEGELSPRSRLWAQALLEHQREGVEALLGAEAVGRLLGALDLHSFAVPGADAALGASSSPPNLAPETLVHSRIRPLRLLGFTLGVTLALGVPLGIVEYFQLYLPPGRESVRELLGRARDLRSSRGDLAEVKWLLGTALLHARVAELQPDRLVDIQLRQAELGLPRGDGAGVAEYPWAVARAEAALSLAREQREDGEEAIDRSLRILDGLHFQRGPEGASENFRARVLEEAHTSEALTDYLTAARRMEPLAWPSAPIPAREDLRWEIIRLRLRWMRETAGPMGPDWREWRELLWRLRGLFEEETSLLRFLGFPRYWSPPLPTSFPRSWEISPPGQEGGRARTEFPEDVEEILEGVLQQAEKRGRDRATDREGDVFFLAALHLEASHPKLARSCAAFARVGLENHYYRHSGRYSGSTVASLAFLLGREARRRGPGTVAAWSFLDQEIQRLREFHRGLGTGEPTPWTDWLEEVLVGFREGRQEGLHEGRHE